MKIRLAGHGKVHYEDVQNRFYKFYNGSKYQKSSVSVGACDLYKKGLLPFRVCPPLGPKDLHVKHHFP